jgi:hypothetical protein
MYYKNVVFVHKNIENDEIFMKSLEREDNIVLLESKYPDISNIIDYFENPIFKDIINIDNVAFIYHYPGYEVLPFYQDKYYKSLHDNNTIKKSKYSYISDNISNLLKYLKGNFSISHVDIMTCNLNSKYYKDDIENIENDINIQIRYSFNNIGNSIDWVLESHNVNIKDIYFNNNINKWDGVLTQAITNFSDLELKSTGEKIFDVKNIDVIIDGETITKKYIKIRDNIKILKWLDISGIEINGYFFIAKNEVFDGNNIEIDASGIFLYDGLFAFDYNGLWSFTSDEKYYPLIKNLGIINGKLLYGGCGYFVRLNQFFFIINNCYNKNNISFYSGGFVGIPSFNSLTLRHIIRNCYNSGNIDRHGGGIVSSYSGVKGYCIIENCYNTGNIRDYGGGISGSYSGMEGICNIKNCYNSGDISEYAGGISGAYSAIGGIFHQGNCSIFGCYNIGNISRYGGGIIGYGLCNNTDNNISSLCNITNCYNTGNISTNSGGIVGSNANYNVYMNSFGSINITNCYNTGSFMTGSSSGLIGIMCEKINIKNCYTDGIRYINGVDIIDNGVDMNNNNIHILNYIKNINSQNDLFNLFDQNTDFDFIIDNFSNKPVVYPLINGIKNKYYKYEYYNSNNIQLYNIIVNNWNKNIITNYNEVKEFFDSNSLINNIISLFLENLENKLINIQYGITGDYIIVNNKIFKYYRKFTNDRSILREELNVPDEGILYFESGIILYNDPIIINDNSQIITKPCYCKPRAMPLQFNTHNNIVQISNKMKIASKLKYNRNFR